MLCAVPFYYVTLYIWVCRVNIIVYTHNTRPVVPKYQEKRGTMAFLQEKKEIAWKDKTFQGNTCPKKNFESYYLSHLNSELWLCYWTNPVGRLHFQTTSSIKLENRHYFFVSFSFEPLIHRAKGWTSTVRERKKRRCNRQQPSLGQRPKFWIFRLLYAI